MVTVFAAAKPVSGSRREQFHSVDHGAGDLLFRDQSADAVARHLVRPAITRATEAPAARRRVMTSRSGVSSSTMTNFRVRQVGQRDRFLQRPGRPQSRVPGQEADESLRLLRRESRKPPAARTRSGRNRPGTHRRARPRTRVLHDIPRLVQVIEVGLESVGDVVSPTGQLLGVNALRCSIFRTP